MGSGGRSFITGREAFSVEAQSRGQQGFGLGFGACVRRQTFVGLGSGFNTNDVMIRI